MKKFRIIVDILMYIIIITLMGYHITNNLIHEILGTALLILFVIHTILNYKWYKSLPKGKYNFKRIFLTIVNILLIIFMLGTILSGILMSKNLYIFLNISSVSLMRTIHKLFSIWLLIIMSIHLGIHLKPLMTKIKKSNFEYILYLLEIVMIIFGIYGFVTDKLWQDMFMWASFKMFNYEESLVIFYLKYISISLGISFIINKIFNKK